jgi:hypothetical protein
MVALDHTLVASFGFGLVAFRPEQRCSALDPNQTRFLVPAAELPPAVQSTLRGRDKRACIHDKTTGKTGVEIQWALPRRILHEVLDMGPKSHS